LPSGTAMKLVPPLMGSKVAGGVFSPVSRG
jgi:hypothetical protein